MKRVITVVLVMAVLLVVAPWVIGNVAQERVDRGLDEFVKTAPYLGIAERKYLQGWFRSEQEVTFKILGGALRPAGADIRFTVQNEILHGPVLGLAGLGLARVNTKLLLDEKTRARLVEIFNTDAPVRVTTKVGFFGGATTTISADARTVRPKGGRGEISWNDFDLDIGYSSHFDAFHVAGDWDRFDARDDSTKFRLVMREMTLDADGKRLGGDLYDADLDFKLDELSYVGPGEAATIAKDLHCEVDSTDDGDFLSIAMRVGSGAIESKGLTARGLHLEAVHNDVTFRRLHIVTLEKLLADMRAARGPAASAGTGQLDDRALELLKYEPEFVIDRIGIETPDGEAYLRGVIRLKGVSDKDLRMGALSLLARLDADLKFEAPQKLLEKIEGGRDAMRGAVDGQYAELKGDKVVSHLEFHGGELKINGKVQGIPGLGAPPPGPE